MWWLIGASKETRILLRTLLEDNTIQDQNALSVEKIMEFLTLYTNSTYFRDKDVFYKQKEGLPVGGSLGPMYLTFLWTKFKLILLIQKFWNINYIEDMFTIGSSSWNKEFVLLIPFMKTKS